MTAVDTMRRLLAATLTDMADFDAVIHDALDSLPSDLREQMSNVDIVVEEDPPPGQRLLGLYQDVPLTRRAARSSRG